MASSSAEAASRTAAKDAAIGLLDEAASQISGAILETQIAAKEKPGR